jgi:hypothetical protein
MSAALAKLEPNSRPNTATETVFIDSTQTVTGYRRQPRSVEILKKP